MIEIGRARIKILKSIPFVYGPADCDPLCMCECINKYINTHLASHHIAFRIANILCVCECVRAWVYIYLFWRLNDLLLSAWWKMYSIYIVHSRYEAEPLIYKDLQRNCAHDHIASHRWCSADRRLLKLMYSVVMRFGFSLFFSLFIKSVWCCCSPSLSIVWSYLISVSTLSIIVIMLFCWNVMALWLPLLLLLRVANFIFFFNFYTYQTNRLQCIY